MSSSGIFPSDDWSLSQGETDNGPIFIRYRPGDPLPDEQQKFGFLIIIIWAYEPRDDSGLPTSDTLSQMEEFEERILDASDDDAWWGSGVAVVTRGGVREWRFYATDVDIFQEEFSKALSGLGPYPLQFEVFEDPDWTGFAEIKDSIA